MLYGRKRRPPAAASDWHNILFDYTNLPGAALLSSAGKWRRRAGLRPAERGGRGARRVGSACDMSDGPDQPDGRGAESADESCATAADTTLTSVGLNLSTRPRASFMIGDILAGRPALAGLPEPALFRLTAPPQPATAECLTSSPDSASSPRLSACGDKPGQSDTRPQQMRRLVIPRDSTDEHCSSCMVRSQTACTVTLCSY